MIFLMKNNDLSKKKTIIAAGVDGCIRYFDIRMGKVTVDHVGEAITTMQISNDDQCVLVGCLDSKVSLCHPTWLLVKLAFSPLVEAIRPIRRRSFKLV